MTGFFWAAPVHEQASTNFAVDYGNSLPALLYRVVFDFYLVYCLVEVTRTCLRHAFTPGDKPRTTSLLFIAGGAAAAAVAAFVAGAGMLLRYVTGYEVLVLGNLNSAAIVLAGLLAGIGVLVPIPVDTFLRWRRARSTCQSLDPLWTGLTKAVPDVVLPVQSGPSPLVRVELTSARRRIEIADALSRIRIDDRRAAVIRHSEDPPAALGRALRDTSTWATSGSAGVVAAELLRADAADDDLQQILAVAGAYEASS